jgi:hypothetical protein
MTRLRAHLSYANVMATLALFVALGGSAYAAVRISGSQIRDRSIPARKVKRNSLSGQEIAERKLGTVPRAFAATQAQTADQAETAANALRLDGKAPSDYRASCPANALQRAGDVCFSRTRLAPASWPAALQVCRSRQLRLPTPGELALMYDHNDALQNAAWTDVGYAYTGGGTRALTLAQTTTRVLQTGDTPRNLALAYYCVTSPTDSP